MALLALPVETGQRIQSRLSRISEELFSILDEAREHGGNHIMLTLNHPFREEQIKVLIADGSAVIQT